MLLKSKAPSLKSQINCNTLSIEKFSNSHSNNKDIVSDVKCCQDPIKSDITTINSKHSCVESNDVQFFHHKNDILNSNLSIIIDNVISNSVIDEDHVGSKENQEVSDKQSNLNFRKLRNLKRKSESDTDEFNSRETNETKKSTKKARKMSNVSGRRNLVTPKSLDSGVYVDCDMCHKTRYLKDVMDPSELPTYWICEMDSSKTLTCEILQDNFDDSVDYFVNNRYTLGSVVWAKAPGFCWWPAIIDDDPDLGLFYWCFENSNDVSHYHVTFLDDDVSRSWINHKDIKVFRGKSDINSIKFMKSKKTYTKTMTKAVERAEECLKLSLQECLNKFSFAVRYTGQPNVWTTTNLPSKRKTKSKNLTPNCDSESSELSEKKLPSDNSEIKNKKLKIKRKLGALNTEVSVLEAQSEVLMALNQQTKHDLIVKNNSLKENKKVGTKSRKRYSK